MGKTTNHKQSGGLDLKIVQLITRMDTIGGAQVHVRDISVELKKSGHDIYLVAGGKKNVHDVLEKDDIQLIYSKYLIRNLNLISDIKAVLEVRKIIRKIQPDIIAIHSSKAGVVGRIAGWSLRIPTIFTAHGWSYTDGVSKTKRRLYIFLETIMGRISDGVIAVSEYDKELAIKQKVLPGSKVFTIHNGVHGIENQNKLFYSYKQPNIIMVARFAPPKRQLQLLKVLNQIRHIQWKMYFAGDGPLLQMARDYVEREGLCDRVYFLGNRQDISDLLQKSDIFILQSDWEGLPLSILEAMRCGLPIIASDVGGVKEAVKQSINGFLIPKDDEQELLNRVAQLLTNPRMRLEMGKHGKSIYEEHFTFKKMMGKTLSFYEKTVEMKQTR